MRRLLLAAAAALAITAPAGAETIWSQSHGVWTVVLDTGSYNSCQYRTRGETRNGAPVLVTFDISNLGIAMFFNVGKDAMIRGMNGAAGVAFGNTTFGGTMREGSGTKMFRTSVTSLVQTGDVDQGVAFLRSFSTATEGAIALPDDSVFRLSLRGTLAAAKSMSTCIDMLKVMDGPSNGRRI